MCDDCGVSAAQYARARSLIGAAGWARLYQIHDSTCLMELDVPSDTALSNACDQVYAYTVAHRRVIAASAENPSVPTCRLREDRRAAEELGC